MLGHLHAQAALLGALAFATFACGPPPAEACGVQDLASWIEITHEGEACPPCTDSPHPDYGGCPGSCAGLGEALEFTVFLENRCHEPLSLEWPTNCVHAWSWQGGRFDNLYSRPVGACFDDAPAFATLAPGEIMQIQDEVVLEYEGVYRVGGGWYAPRVGDAPRTQPVPQAPPPGHEQTSLRLVRIAEAPP